MEEELWLPVVIYHQGYSPYPQAERVLEYYNDASIPYEVSNLGRLRSVDVYQKKLVPKGRKPNKTYTQRGWMRRGRPVKLEVSPTRAVLCAPIYCTYWDVDQIVLSAFDRPAEVGEWLVPNGERMCTEPHQTEVAHHVDGNPLNCRLDNLLWVPCPEYTKYLESLKT